MSKVFVGFVKVKEVQGQNGAWEYTQISFKDDDLQKLAQYKNDAGYVNLKLNRSQKGSEYLEIDTYGLNQQPATPQPQAAQATPPPASTPPPEFPAADGSQIPF